MAEDFFVCLNDGQEIEVDDINLLGSVGGLADDHVLAELLRLAPFGGAVAKAILPFGHQGSGPTPTVSPAGATGSLTVAPFRAVAGSRDTLASIGPRRVWNDLRSGIFTGAAQGTLTASLQLAANTATAPRWDLVYAALQTDANGAAVSRYRKDPTTEQVSVSTVVSTRTQIVTVSVVQGAAVTPLVKPTLPPDANGFYYFPLVYVRVPAGFNATSTVLPQDIDEVMPFVPLARTLGAGTTRPADQQWQEGGTVVGSANFGWTGVSGQRPGPFLPPTMAGTESLLVAMDLSNANSAFWSHPPNSLVDSRDWRFRVWDWRCFVAPMGNSPIFAWAPGNVAAVRAPQVMIGGGPSAIGVRFTIGMGQSFVPDNPVLASGAAAVLELNQGNLSALPAAAHISLYVDHQDGGKLKAFAQGAPTALVFIWLTASAPFPNA